MKTIRFTLTALTACALLGVQAQASVISVNFVSGGDGGDSSLDSCDSAGVVPAVNWTNPSSSQDASNLKDATGTATTADLDTTLNGSGNSPVGGGDNPNEEMLLTGRVFKSGSPEISMALTQIPYALYDIYAYVVDQNTSDGEPLSVSDGITTFLVTTPSDEEAFFEANGFVQASSTTTTTTANYVKFSGLSGTSQTLTLLNLGDSDRAGFAGFQIVEVPEPASLALMGLGGLLMIGRSRRA